MSVVIVNFSHPLSADQLAQIEQLCGQTVQRVVDVPTRFDPDRPFGPQAAGLIEGVGLTGAEWQTLPLLINLPSFSAIAALVLAELHGVMGHFPTIVRLRPVAGSMPPRFEGAEIIGLQAVRDGARQRR